MPHKQCICQICSCGRHRCPHRSGRTTFEISDEVPCFVTEYGTQYPGDLADRVTSFKPENRPFRIPTTPMERLSTTAQDFVNHPAQKTASFKPNRQFTEPEEAMDSNTTYNATFEGRAGDKEESYKPDAGHRVVGAGQYRAEQTSEGKRVLYGDPEDYENVGQSQSHEDYRGRSGVPLPIRVRRKLSDHINFGQDSPTYYTTNHSSYSRPYPSFLPNESKINRVLADGVDQMVDHVVFGTSPAGKMLSTNHADYLRHPISDQNHHGKSKNFLNDSGFVFGEDDTVTHLTTTQDQYRDTFVVPAGIKAEHQDLFRSSTGLLFGQSSARYVTQSQADFARKDVAPRDRSRAQLNKEQLQKSAGIVFGQDSPGVRGKTTSSAEYGRHELNNLSDTVERTKRDLFRPTDGYLLDYGSRDEPEEDVSPRYSTASKIIRSSKRQVDDWREQSVRGENELDEFANGDRPSYDSRRDMQGRRRRHRRTMRRLKGAWNKGRSTSVVVSPQHQSRDSRRMSLSELAGEVQSMSNATLDSNGLLWFPVSSRKDRQKGLPKWAETALKEAQPSGERRDNRAEIADLKQPTMTSSPSQPRNYAKQNEQRLSGPADRSILSSTSDEGLVLDSLHDGAIGNSVIRQTADNLTQERDHLSAPSPYSRDSMESGRQSPVTSEGFDSLDSLERARSGFEGSVDDTVMNRGDGDDTTDVLPKTNGVESQSFVEPNEDSSILERTRERMPVPKLIPFQHDSHEQSATTHSESKHTKVMESRDEDNQRKLPQPSESLKNNEGVNRDQTAVDNLPKASADSVTHAGNSHLNEDSHSVGLQEEEKGDQKSIDKDLAIRIVNEQIPQKSSKTQQENSAKNRRSSSVSSSQQLKQRVAAGVSANQTVESHTSPGQQRKGRRLMGNASSSRNQYPRATSLGGLMKQGYLEQTTTSHSDYNVPAALQSANTPMPKPRFQKKIPISENGEYVLTTSRPLQHSPRDMASKQELYELGEIDQSDKRSTVRLSPKSRSAVTPSRKTEKSNETLPEDNSPGKPTSARQASIRNERKESSSHRMPANWTRTLPFRFADTLRFGGDESSRHDWQTRTKTDYQGAQLSHRAQSLNRKQLRSQLVDILAAPDGDSSSQRGRRHRSQEPSDYRGMFADRRVPFTFNDHDIFPAGREKFDGRTVNREAYQGQEQVIRETSSKPADQLHIFSGDSEMDARTVTQDTYLASYGSRPAPFRPVDQLDLFKDGAGSVNRTVAQDVYQGEGGSRPAPFRPQTTLDIFDGQDNDPMVSTSQNDYQVVAVQSRRKPLRPRSAMSSSGIYTASPASVESSARSRRRNNRHAARSTHTAGLPSRTQPDILPPVRGAVSSARSFDESRVPFSATTTNHSDFRDPGAVIRPQMVRQYSSGALKPLRDSRISPSTTSHAAFKKYSNPEHALPVLPKENHLFATGDRFSNQTTNKDDYQPFSFEPALARNVSARPAELTRSLNSSGRKKERSSFATRTTNMDTYQANTTTNGRMETVFTAAGLSSSAVSHGQGSRQKSAVKGGTRIPAQEDVCPAALILAGQVVWEYAGNDHGHDYYNLDS